MKIRSKLIETPVGSQNGIPVSQGVLPTKTPMRRFTISVLPAAGMTVGLFLAMAALIAVDFMPAEAEVSRVIDRIVPELIEETEVQARPKLEPIRAAVQPPPPPKFSVQKTDIDLPTPSILGTAPTEILVNQVQSLDVRPVAISDRDAQPINRPVPIYPARAVARGIEGECQVRFNVDVRGRPYNVDADCTDSLFKSEAERAVADVKFASKLVAGEARERSNVVYPLSFKLEAN
ncbi:MAG: TonB family protein [Hyphomonadaceae bacterium]